MLSQRKEVMIRSRTINGQTMKQLTTQEKLPVLIKIVQNKIMSQAFDVLFECNKSKVAIINTKQGKIDKNLIEILLQRDKNAFIDLRSRSPMRSDNKSVFSRRTYSRRALRKVRTKKESVMNKSRKSRMHSKSNYKVKSMMGTKRNLNTLNVPSSLKQRNIYQQSN